MKLPLVLALMFLALPALADNETPPMTEKSGAAAELAKAHPDLLRLEKALSRKQEDKKSGRVPLEQYQKWETEFRTFLDATMARVPPSPNNTAVHARIVAMLGELGRAGTALDQALEQNPESPILIRTKGQILYEQNDFPGAARHGLQAWENSGRTDQDAWFLYQRSKDRITPSNVAPSSLPGSPPLSQGTAIVSADDPSKPYKLAISGRAKPGEVPGTMKASMPNEPTPAHSPFLPILLLTGTGLTAFGIYQVAQSKNTRTSDVGANPIPKDSPGQARSEVPRVAESLYRGPKQTYASEEGLNPAPDLPQDQGARNWRTSRNVAGALFVAAAVWEFGPGALAAAGRFLAATGPTTPTAQLAMAGAGAGSTAASGGALIVDHALVTSGVNAAGAAAALVAVGKTAHDHISYSKSQGQSAPGNDRESWRSVRPSRPLNKMGHAQKHLSDFQKLDPSLRADDVARILEYARLTGQSVPTANGGKLITAIVEIGGRATVVKVVESAAGLIKTGFYEVP